MTRRVLLAALTLVAAASFSIRISGQTPAAGQGQSSPPAPAKWVAPYKGLATIQVIRGNPRRVGSDMVSLLKIKNTTTGAIALLSVEEFWYDDKGAVISGDSQKVKRLIGPGEIVEVTTKSPWKQSMSRNAFTFSHANGKVEAKQVPKFADK